jgi:hypothetical protein
VGDYLGLWRHARRFGWPEWGLPDLLTVMTEAGLVRRSRWRDWPGSPDDRTLFHAESTVLCQFLWFAGDGKYRPKLVEYLRRGLGGDSGPEVFKDVFGLHGLAGFGGTFPAMEAEWKAWVDELLVRDEDD